MLKQVVVLRICSKRLLRKTHSFSVSTSSSSSTMLGRASASFPRAFLASRRPASSSVDKLWKWMTIGLVFPSGVTSIGELLGQAAMLGHASAGFPRAFLASRRPASSSVELPQTISTPVRSSMSIEAPTGWSAMQTKSILPPPSYRAPPS